MDESKERIQPLKDNAELTAVVGKCTSLNDLNAAGVKDSDLFIGVTPEESRNILAGMLASNMGAKRPSHESIITNTFYPKMPLF